MTTAGDSGRKPEDVIGEFFPDHDAAKNPAEPLPAAGRALVSGASAEDAAFIGADADEAPGPIDWLTPSAPASNENIIVMCFGDYELLAEVARNQVGVRYRARQTPTHRPTALWVLDGPDAAIAERRRFYHAAEALRTLTHPHLLPVHEIGECQGLRYVATSLLAESLEHNRDCCRDDWRAASRLVAATAEAVDCAHRHGVLHGCLKPADILLDGNAWPKVGGFGMIDEPRAVVYRPPEQALGKAPVSVAADVYALGAVLYELLTGRVPFPAARPDLLRQLAEEDPVRPRRLRPALPLELEAACLKCLRKQPGARYATAGELAEDLRRFLDGRSVSALPVRGHGRALRWAGYAAVLAAGVIFGAGALLWQAGGMEVLREPRAERGETFWQRKFDFERDNARAERDRAAGDAKAARRREEAAAAERDQALRRQALATGREKMALVERDEALRQAQAAFEREKTALAGRDSGRGQGLMELEAARAREAALLAERDQARSREREALATRDEALRQTQAARNAEQAARAERDLVLRREQGARAEAVRARREMADADRRLVLADIEQHLRKLDLTRQAWQANAVALAGQVRKAMAAGVPNLPWSGAVVATAPPSSIRSATPADMAPVNVKLASADSARQVPAPTSSPVPRPPTSERAEPAPLPDRLAQAEALPEGVSGRITVLVPPDSRMMVDGEELHRVGQQGGRRVFHIPRFSAADGPNFYVLSATWLDDDGQPVRRQRKLQVEPGKSYEVDLRTRP
jgi:hypothetical protein